MIRMTPEQNRATIMQARYLVAQSLGLCGKSQLVLATSEDLVQVMVAQREKAREACVASRAIQRPGAR